MTTTDKYVLGATLLAFVPIVIMSLLSLGLVR